MKKILIGKYSSKNKQMRAYYTIKSLFSFLKLGMDKKDKQYMLFVLEKHFYKYFKTISNIENPKIRAKYQRRLSLFKGLYPNLKDRLPLTDKETELETELKRRQNLTKKEREDEDKKDMMKCCNEIVLKQIEEEKIPVGKHRLLFKQPDGLLYLRDIDIHEMYPSPDRYIKECLSDRSYCEIESIQHIGSNFEEDEFYQYSKEES